MRNVCEKLENYDYREGKRRHEAWPQVRKVTSAERILFSALYGFFGSTSTDISQVSDDSQECTIFS